MFTPCLVINIAQTFCMKKVTCIHIMEWCFSRKSSHFIIIIVILYWLLQVIPASPGREYCFSFWFYVHGDRTSVNWNKLTIYILVNASHDSMSSEADLLDITGDFGDVWNSGHVNISTVYTQKPFQVRLLDIHVKQKNLSFSCMLSWLVTTSPHLQQLCILSFDARKTICPWVFNYYFHN